VKEAVQKNVICDNER